MRHLVFQHARAVFRPGRDRREGPADGRSPGPGHSALWSRRPPHRLQPADDRSRQARPWPSWTRSATRTWSQRPQHLRHPLRSARVPQCKTATQTNCLAVLNQNGQRRRCPPGDIGWGEEIDLDVQTAHEICQNCRIKPDRDEHNSYASLAAGVNTAAAAGRERLDLEQLRRVRQSTATRRLPTTTRTTRSRSRPVTQVRHRAPGEPEHGRRGRRDEPAAERRQHVQVRDRLVGDRFGLLGDHLRPGMADHGLQLGRDRLRHQARDERRLGGRRPGDRRGGLRQLRRLGWSRSAGPACRPR